VVWFTMLEELPYFDGAGAPFSKPDGLGYPNPVFKDLMRMP